MIRYTVHMILLKQDSGSLYVGCDLSDWFLNG